MKNTLLYFNLLLLAFVSSCNKPISNEVLKTVDTLNFNKTRPVLKGAKEKLLNHYYLRFGIAIPEYYTIKDSLALDINGDNSIDTAVIFSPISLEGSNYSDYETIDAPKRILVEIINFGEHSKIRNIYDNLNSNIGGVLSKYNGIFKTKNGFEIHHESGSKYSWNYISEFSTQFKDSIYLIKIEKVCSFDGNDKKEEYLYDKKSVSNININDTINKNCNCDKIWMDLEKSNGQ